MSGYLNKPFPFIENRKYQVVASFFFALFIYVFLLIFQPFGISEITFYKPLYISGFAFISFIVLILNFCIISKFCKPDRWTIKENMISISVQFLIISILNWLYHSTVGQEIEIQYSLPGWMLITISVGIIPTLFLLYFVEKYLAGKNQRYASNLTGNIGQEVYRKKDEIRIRSKNKDEEIKIGLDQFVCAKSEGNYINVFYKENDKIASKLLRSSISSLEEQLIPFSGIKRCHRSYIVNFENIIKVTGNARNFSLHVSKLNFTIPVSRSFPKTAFDDFFR